MRSSRRRARAERANSSRPTSPISSPGARFGFPASNACNGFSMAALRGADGAFLLGEMSPHTASAGAIYFPAGTPERQDVAATSSISKRALDESCSRRPARRRRGRNRAGLVCRARRGPRRVHEADAARAIGRSGQGADRRGLAAEPKPEFSRMHVVRERGGFHGSRDRICPRLHPPCLGKRARLSSGSFTCVGASASTPTTGGLSGLRGNSKLRASYSSLLAFNSSIGMKSALTILASAAARMRRIASGRVGRGPTCAAIHASSPDSSFGSRRTPIDVAFPAGAGSGFRFCGDTAEAFIQFCYHSSRRSEIGVPASQAARQASRRQTIGVGLLSNRLLSQSTRWLRRGRACPHRR